MAPVKNDMNKREYNLHENSYFQWLHLIDSISERWKEYYLKNYENTTYHP